MKFVLTLTCRAVELSSDKHVANFSPFDAWTGVGASCVELAIEKGTGFRSNAAQDRLAKKNPRELSRVDMAVLTGSEFDNFDITWSTTMSTAISAPSLRKVEMAAPLPPMTKMEASEARNDSSADSANSKAKPGPPNNRSSSVMEQELLNHLYADYWSL